MKYKYLGSAGNIDHSRLPIKALVSTLDPDLAMVRQNLRKSSYQSHFQLGEIGDAAPLRLRHCFIYIAMITDNQYFLLRDTLVNEINTAKNKSLYRIFLLQVTNKDIKFSVSDAIKLARWGWILLVWTVDWFRRPCPRKEVNRFEKNTQGDNSLAIRVGEMFEQCLRKMEGPAILVNVNIPFNAFCQDSDQQVKLRREIARHIKIEPEFVWLIAQENIENVPTSYQSYPILVLLPVGADLSRLEKLRSRMVKQVSSGSKPSPGKVEKLSVEVVLHGGRIGINFDVLLPKATQYERKVFYRDLSASFDIFKAAKEQMTRLSPVILLSTLEILYLQLPPEYRDTLEAYGRKAKDFRNECSDKISAKIADEITKTRVFICYDYVQEKKLRDSLNHHLKTLKKYLPGCNKYKITRICRKPPAKISNAIDKSGIFVVLWGDKTRFSGNVKTEFNLARQKNKPIILLDGRSDATVPLDFALTECYKYVLWDTATDVGRALLEVTERFLNEK